jgi:apolipoprotein N-acyltransferase
MTTDIRTPRILSAPCALPVPQMKLAPRCSRVFLAALASAGLLWLSYFPLAWGWLGWVALVPLLALVRATASRRRIGLAAWVAGLAFYWPVLQWIRVADDRMYATWAALAMYCSFYVPIGIGLVRLLDRRTRLPLVVTFPAVWTGLEYVRAHALTGFPWYFLGHTQHAFLALTQVADLGGAYAVTVLVAAVNVLFFEWLCRAAWFRRLLVLPQPVSDRRPLLVQSAAVLVVLAAVLAYGAWRLEQNDFAEGPVVALIQSNLDQRVKIAASAVPGADAATTMVRHNTRLTDYACSQPRRPDLIVWPETSVPDDWVEISPQLSDAQVPSPLRSEEAETQKQARGVAKRWKTHALLGVNGKVLGPDERVRRYNSAALIMPDGRQCSRYDKMHRVPFGEYVPLRDWMPWMDQFAPYDYDYSVQIGEQFTRFALGNYHFGVVICYEDTDPYLARQYVDPGVNEPKVDFLLNISNDGWFNGTSEHEEHLAICRFRAIECRRAVARSVNMGISGVIDGNGRVRVPEQGYLVKLDATGRGWHWKGLPDEPFAGDTLPMSEWPGFKKTAGVLLTTIPIDSRSSLYARWGDWLPLGCWLLVGLSLFVAVVWPARRDQVTAACLVRS